MMTYFDISNEQFFAAWICASTAIPDRKLAVTKLIKGGFAVSASQAENIVDFMFSEELSPPAKIGLYLLACEIGERFDVTELTQDQIDRAAKRGSDIWLGTMLTCIDHLSMARC